MTEIVQLLRELEWSGRASGYAESFASCPVCRGVQPDQQHAHIYFLEVAIGHKDGCRLDSAAASLEAQEPVGHLWGVSMRQEDLNEMMRLPGERVEQQKIQVPTCPRCGERYCGDGVLPCLECKATEKQE